MINDLIKRLRKAADSLENLLDIYPESNLKVKRELNKEFSKRVSKDKLKKVSNKGYNYKGNHWTQKPENKPRLIKMIKKSSRTRLKNLKVTNEKKDNT